MRKNKSTVINTDILIAGGGPSGCALAAMLGKAGIDVTCVDMDNPEDIEKKSFDGRTLAISYGSSIIMQRASLWKAIEEKSCPIKTIQVVETGSPTLLDFLATDASTQSLGWVVENRDLRRALFDALKTFPSCHHIAPARITEYQLLEDGIISTLEDGRTIKSRLVVGADGRKSFTRQWAGIPTRNKDFNQKAIVCIVRHEHPHNNIAIEDFRQEGPFAILPLPDDANGNHRSSIVWTQHSAKKDSCLEWDEKTFNAALQERFPASYGRVEQAGTRFSYPLTLLHAQSYTAPRMALVADAAHGIHPIAGQGLNLGLRDIDALASLLIAAKEKQQDYGDEKMLKQYEHLRRLDNSLMAGATDLLNGLFSNNSASVRIARTLGLKLVQKLPRVRRFFMHQAMGKSALK